MIKESLFAAEERETKLSKLGDILQVLEKHVDFAALAAAIDLAASRHSRERGGRPPFPTEIMVKTLLSSNCITSAMNNWNFNCWIA
jgi:IS5 family transposase